MFNRDKAFEEQEREGEREHTAGYKNNLQNSFLFTLL
jgi:hypothetical protein